MYRLPIVLLCLIGVSLNAAQTQLQIAVVANKGPRVDYAQALLEGELQQSGQFALVEREKVAATIEELSFQQSGVTDQSNAVAIGQHLNVHKIFYAQTHRVGGKLALTVQIVDVETNQVQRTISENLGTTQQQIAAGVSRLARQLITAAALFAPAEMVAIPAGRFKMGSEIGLPDEKPVHLVALSAYEIDRYEVTRLAYESYLVAEGRKKKADLRHPQLPVVNVSWNDADAYCRSRGARLPTEAEWEYAARGPIGGPYPWGDTPPNPALARFGGQERKPLKIGSLPRGASPFGVHDLAGNVAEWVWDWWQPGYYEHSPPKDPQGPADGDYRVARGGSWNQPPDELRTRARLYHNPYKGAGHIGFRCAKSAGF
ncbi:SUMF1/EgtB/PvdO family nonheme iron enzyme [bacterium]|nr:SUMF1/EgtB/PvdO family nonheme iron enzyme [bacterium]